MQLPIQQKVNLKDWTWWKVGGNAQYFYLPKNLEELKQAVSWALENHLSITIISGGTNVLVSDQGIQGLVIHLKYLNHTYIKEDNHHIQITTLAGTPKHEIFKIFSKRKLAPSLFLCGLPGDMGGGVVMNAGVGDASLTPREFSQIVEWIEVFCYQKRELKRLTKKELQWSYRICKGWEEGVIYQVGLSWPLQPIKEFSKKLKDVHKKRTMTQPLNQPSCGSVFKNPKKEKSGRLIEQLGLKGFSIGQAEVSKKHANFIINKGGATAMDIHQIICHIQNKVRQSTGINLEPEVRYLGNWDKSKGIQ